MHELGSEALRTYGIVVYPPFLGENVLNDLDSSLHGWDERIIGLDEFVYSFHRRDVHRRAVLSTCSRTKAD